MKFINENEMKNKHGIYAIINIKSKRVYIGQTKQPFIKRYWHHQWKLKDGTHDNKYLQNAWDKYKEKNFIFIVIECVETLSSDVINRLEEKYIACCKRMKYNYNIIDGGGGRPGVNLSIEHKQKIGEKNKIAMLGKKHSDETKQKMSNAHKGKHVNRSDYTVSPEQIYRIKTLLINGMKPSDVAKTVNVQYKSVNAIMSNNCWANIIVEGWDEWRANRKTWKRLTKEDHAEIYRLHIEEGYSKEELAEMYDKTIKMIEKIFREFKNNHKTIQCQAS